MKTILAGILVLVVIANADKPCEVPKRFVGTYDVFTDNIDADKIESANHARLYYDGNNKRMRVDGEKNGQEYIVMLFYQEAKQYVVSQGHCFVMPIKGHFKGMSIPANASLVTGGRIGTASNGLDINRYYAEEDEGKGIVTVTQQDCVISSFVFLAKSDGANHIVYGSMTDVDLGYDDDVFNKPEGCQNLPGTRARRSVGGVLESLQGVMRFF